MSRTDIAVFSGGNAVAVAGHEAAEYVTTIVADQMFGIPVLQVQDVLGPQRVTRIPLAPKEVAGALNLRGRIVTAIDVRTRLGMPPRPADSRAMSIVVEHGGELYSLIVDEVGEVLSLPGERLESNPPTLDSGWRSVSLGIHRLEGRLLVVVDVARLLDFTRAEAA
ncbi:MAG: chemotaxis protein CheW [Rhodospirillales bacterium]|jgi:purine-binding chemotaxis protein CheW|nr:chemotaxis protein CheW [Rhodospirillales bacterium]